MDLTDPCGSAAPIASSNPFRVNGEQFLSRDREMPGDRRGRARCIACGQAHSGGVWPGANRAALNGPRCLIPKAAAFGLTRRGKVNRGTFSHPGTFCLRFTNTMVSFAR